MHGEGKRYLLHVGKWTQSVGEDNELFNGINKIHSDYCYIPGNDHISSYNALFHNNANCDFLKKCCHCD